MLSACSHQKWQVMMSINMIGLALERQFEKQLWCFHFRNYNLIIFFQNIITQISMIRSKPPSTRQNTSRVSNVSSANSSMISTSNPYPKCDIKKQHAKQFMNLICISNNCKNRGPICSQCKSTDHSTHIVMPIRMLMQKINKKYLKPENQASMAKKQETGEGTIEQPLNQKNKQLDEARQIIENNKLQMLSVLNIAVKQIASRISNLQQIIIKQYERSIQQIETMRETQENMAKIVEDFMDTPPTQTDIFKSRLKNLIGIINTKSKDNIQIDLSYGHKALSYKNNSQNFQNNITDWFVQSKELLDNAFKINQKAKKNTQTSKTVKFSTELKSKSISLTNQNKIAKQTDTKSVGFAITTASLIKQKTISFKIVNLTNNIKVGVCLKDIIKSKAYKLNQAAIGHGSYLLANNSYTFSHSDANYNMSIKGFNFQTGDIIEVSYLNNQLKFSKKNNDSAKCVIPIKKPTEVEEKQFNFCVWLGGNGDKIEIV